MCMGQTSWEASFNRFAACAYYHSLTKRPPPLSVGRFSAEVFTASIANSFLASLRIWMWWDCLYTLWFKLISLSFQLVWFVFGIAYHPNLFCQFSSTYLSYCLQFRGLFIVIILYILAISLCFLHVVCLIFFFFFWAALVYISVCMARWLVHCFYYTLNLYTKKKRCKLHHCTVVYTSTRCLAHNVMHCLHHFEHLIVHNIDS